MSDDYGRVVLIQSDNYPFAERPCSCPEIFESPFPEDSSTLVFVQWCRYGPNKSNTIRTDQKESYGLNGEAFLPNNQDGSSPSLLSNMHTLITIHIHRDELHYITMLSVRSRLKWWKEMIIALFQRPSYAE